MRRRKLLERVSIGTALLVGPGTASAARSGGFSREDATHIATTDENGERQVVALDDLDDGIGELGVDPEDTCVAPGTGCCCLCTCQNCLCNDSCCCCDDYHRTTDVCARFPPDCCDC